MLSYTDDDKIIYRHIISYSKSMETIVAFVDNVMISSLDEISANYLYQGFQNIFKQFNVKAVRPIKKLCLRMFEQGAGLNNFHEFFLKVVINTEAYREALPIIESRVLPGENCEKYPQYLLGAAKIYLKLGRYQDAFESLKGIINLEANIQDIPLVFQTYKYLYLLNRSLGHPLSLQKFLKHHLEKFQLRLVNEKESKNKEQVHNLYQQVICHDSEEVFDKLRSSLMEKDEYAFIICSIPTASIQKDVKGHINSRVERIRATEIKGTALDSTSVLTAINNASSLARYDCKNKILYFNHSEIENSLDLNKMITKCYEMYTSLSSGHKKKSRSSKFGSGLEMMMSSKGKKR